MESKAKLFGHPIHTMLIVFPLGLLATSVVFDIVYLVNGSTLWAEMAFWLITGGLIGGVLAGIFGLIDWLAIPKGTRAKMIGAMHGAGNGLVATLFLVSWLFRLDGTHEPRIIALVLSFIGVGLALVTGWLGGELVDRLRVGVDDGAHLNSPNSLSGRPATEDTTPTRRVISNQ